MYNGSNNLTYNTINLSGVLPDEGAGFGAIDFQLPANGLQNGSPDGIALVNGSTVVEFISYEGTITAADGAATGITSDDVGVSEPSTTPIGNSIQRIGIGSSAAAFTWTTSSESAGTLNVGQSPILEAFL